MKVCQPESWKERTHIANVDADIHESDVIGECKVDKSLEIRVRRHLLVASQTLPQHNHSMVFYATYLPECVPDKKPKNAPDCLTWVKS